MRFVLLMKNLEDEMLNNLKNRGIYLDFPILFIIFAM